MALKRPERKAAVKVAVEDPAADAARRMAPRTRAGAAAWLLTAPGIPSPVLFEEAVCRGWIVQG